MISILNSLTKFSIGLWTNSFSQPAATGSAYCWKHFVPACLWAVPLKTGLQWLQISFTSEKHTKEKKRKKKKQTKTCFVLSKNTAAKSPGLTQKQNPNSQIREERAPPVPREPWTLLLQGKKRKGAFPHQICWWVFCWLSFTATYPVTSVAAVNRPPLYPRGKKN